MCAAPLFLVPLPLFISSQPHPCSPPLCTGQHLWSIYDAPGHPPGEQPPCRGAECHHQVPWLWVIPGVERGRVQGLRVELRQVETRNRLRRTVMMGAVVTSCPLHWLRPTIHTCLLLTTRPFAPALKVSRLEFLLHEPHSRRQLMPSALAAPHTAPCFSPLNPRYPCPLDASPFLSILCLFPPPTPHRTSGWASCCVSCRAAVPSCQPAWTPRPTSRRS